MLSKKEQVWRHLLVSSEQGERRWASLATLAGELDFGLSTVHKALGRPVEIGAVRVRGGGGLRLIDPGRLHLLWAASRAPGRDLLEERQIRMPAVEAERQLPADRFVLGGFGAIVAHEGGNFVSGYDRVLCYGDPGNLPASLVGDPDGETILTVLEPDPLLRRYGSVTPASQAYADLFNTPGWPAARFVRALSARLLEPDAA
jgi:hypothetical protein